MSWTKVSENRWERGANGIEGYFITTGNITASICDGREHYILFSKIHIEIDIPDVELALKHAWKQLRYEQPQIATTVEGMTKVYEVPNDEETLQEWLTSTFIVSSAANAEELYQSPSTGPIKQATIYYVPQSSELVLRLHHYTIDGTGMLLLWHSYLNALANPKEIKFGDEYTRLAPTMEEVLGYPLPPTSEQTEKATELLMSWAGSLPGIGPVSKMGTAPSGRCHNTELDFPADTTDAIIKTCKEKGISVTSAVHAAYVLSIVKHADPNSKQSQYVSLGQFNLRPLLPEPYNTSQYAASAYYAPLPFKHDLPSSFWDIAQALNKNYKTGYKGDPKALDSYAALTQLMCSTGQSPEFLAGPAPTDALVSSLGIAERYLQRTYGSTVIVKDLKIGIDVVLGMSFLFIYTFQDRLRCVYGFNDGFEEPENIQIYLEETRRILIEELGV